MGFWDEKTLEEMNEAEWESLCDGCGRCCLHKLRDEDTFELMFTNVACRLLDGQSCRCTQYETRRRVVHDCLRLTPELVRDIDWLPHSCAYRTLAEGRKLPWWHKLISGSAETVHEAGVSVRGRVVAEQDADALDHYITEWPVRPVRVRKPRER